MKSTQRDNGWRELYREAISEHDPEMLMTRFIRAHTAIQERTRDLWYQGSPEVIEREHLAAAAHYLEMLRSLVDSSRRRAA